MKKILIALLLTTVLNSASALKALQIEVLNPTTKKLEIKNYQQTIQYIKQIKQMYNEQQNEITNMIKKIGSLADENLSITKGVNFFRLAYCAILLIKIAQHKDLPKTTTNIQSGIDRIFQFIPKKLYPISQKITDDAISFLKMVLSASWVTGDQLNAEINQISAKYLDTIINSINSLFISITKKANSESNTKQDLTDLQKILEKITQILPSEIISNPTFTTKMALLKSQIAAKLQ